MVYWCTAFLHPNAMLFRAYKPGPPLSGFIEDFWLYDGYSSAYVHERIFPTGTFELVFNLRDDELQIYEGNKSFSCSCYSGALASGPYDAYFVTDRVKEASVMGVQFRPGGAFPFLGLSVYEFANAHIDLAAIWGPGAEQIRERLAAMPSPGSRFRLLEHALLSRPCRPLEHHPAVSLALAGFRSDQSRAVVRKLAGTIVDSSTSAKLFTCGWYQVKDGKIRLLKVVFDPRPVLDAKPRSLLHHVDEDISDCGG